MAAILFGAAAVLARTQLWSHAFQPNSFFGGDFVSYRLGAERLLATGSPYHPRLLEGPLIHSTANLPAGYVYPPPLAQGLALLTWVPDPWLPIAWALAQAALLAWLLPAVFVAGGGRISIEARLVIWAVAFASYPLQFALYGGNVSGFVAIAVSALLVGSPGLAGGVSAVLFTLKLSPLPLFAAALIRPSSRMASIVALAALVLGSLLLSPRAWIDWLRAAPNVLATPMADACCHYSPGATLQLVGAEQIGVALGLSIAVGAGIVAVWWARSERNWDRAVAAASIAMLFAPLTLWEHYAAVLVPLAMYVWPRAGIVRRRILIGAFVWQTAAWFIVFQAPGMAAVESRILTLVALFVTCAAVVPPSPRANATAALGPNCSWRRAAWHEGSCRTR